MKELNDNDSAWACEGLFVVVFVVFVAFVVVVENAVFVVDFVLGLFEVGVLFVVVELFSEFPSSFSTESDFF
jgi:hypothetical protein